MATVADIPQEIPQPFDIAPLPYIPSGPGLLEWLLFALLCGVGVAVVWLRSRPVRVVRKSPLVGQQVLHAVKNVRTLLEGPSPRPAFVKQLLGELSVLSRRSIWDLDPSREELVRIETMTQSEISQVLEEYSQIPSASLLRALLLVESYKYCPDRIIQTELSRIRVRVDELETAAESYYRSMEEGS